MPPFTGHSFAYLSRKYVPHDMASLINLQGGPQNFIDRLDFIIDNVRNT
jgi:putative alpha-1,2-mannosidase